MSENTPREERDAVLGTCPTCSERIPPGCLGILYQPAGGWPRIIAECPGCETLVQPA